MSTVGNVNLADGVLGQLPDDVLRNIFDRLKPWELLCLARISDRIQRISLGIYYAQRGVDISPTGIIDITRQDDYDLLPILRITTFFTRTGHISVVFVFPKWDFMENIRHLTLILRRFISVDMITLTFRYDAEGHANDEGKPAVLRTIAKSASYRGLSSDLQGLFSEAFRVAQVVRILAGEELLEMVGGVLQEKCPVLSRFGLTGLSIINRCRLATKIHVDRIVNLARKGKDKGQEPLPNTSLVTLDIQAGLPLVPPFLSWTVACLKVQPRLKHISLSTVSSNRASWAPLLLNLSIPPLFRLTVGSSACTLGNLAQFVKQHVRLSILDIRDLAPMPTRLPRVANMAFKHITSLIAPCEVLGALFGYRQHVATFDTFFPNLKQVCIVAIVKEERQFKFVQLHQTLAPVVGQLRRLQQLGLELVYEGGESPFRETLNASKEGGGDEVTLIPHFIQHMTLRLKDDLDDQVVGQLADWILGFVHLRELNITSVYQYPYPVQTVIGWRAQAEEEKRRQTREALRYELLAKLTIHGLEHMDFFGERHSLRMAGE